MLSNAEGLVSHSLQNGNLKNPEGCFLGFCSSTLYTHETERHLGDAPPPSAFKFFPSQYCTEANNEKYTHPAKSSSLFFTLFLCYNVIDLDNSPIVGVVKFRQSKRLTNWVGVLYKC